MRTLFFVFLFTLFARGEHFGEAGLKRFQEERAKLLEQANMIPTWGRRKTDGSPGLLAEAEKHFQSVLEKHFGGKEPLPMKDQILSAADPIATISALDHLMDWVDQKGPEWRAAKADFMNVVLNANPYPIEYTLAFENAADFALDKQNGMGLKYEAALEYAAANYRVPNFWEALKQKETEVRAGKWKPYLESRARTLPPIKTLDELKKWAGNQPEFTGIPGEMIRDLFKNAGENLPQTLAAIPVLSKLISPNVSPTELAQHNRQIFQILGSDPLNNAMNYFASVQTTPPPAPSTSSEYVSSALKGLGVAGATAAGALALKKYFNPKSKAACVNGSITLVGSDPVVSVEASKQEEDNRPVADPFLYMFENEKP